MRLTPRQLQTPHPHPPVKMVRCMGPYNAQNPVRPSAVRPSAVRPSVRRPSVRLPSVRPSAVRPSVLLLPQWMGVCDPTTPKTPSNSAVSWNVDACTDLANGPIRAPCFFRFCGRRRTRRSGGGGRQPPILAELRPIAAEFLAVPTPRCGRWG